MFGLRTKFGTHFLGLLIMEYDIGKLETWRSPDYARLMLFDHDDEKYKLDDRPE